MKDLLTRIIFWGGSPTVKVRSCTFASEIVSIVVIVKLYDADHMKREAMKEVDGEAEGNSNGAEGSGEKEAK